MFYYTVTADEILQIIHNFSNNQVPGNNNINSKLLKEVSDITRQPLTYIFNLSFETGIVRDILKIAKVIPL